VVTLFPNKNLITHNILETPSRGSNMRKTLLIVLILIGLMPAVMPCSSPIFYNEYGVPMNIFYGGAYALVDFEDYPGQQMVIYNLTVNNTDKDSGLTLYLAPSELDGYVYVEPSYYIPADQKAEVGVHVYVDGPDKSGVIYISGTCDDAFPAPDGSLVMGIFGRGNGAPDTCDGTQSSCGIWPDCQELYSMSGCHYGYYRNYFCSDNNVMYSQACTNYCCQEYMGFEGYCSAGICEGTPPSCQSECGFSGSKCVDGNLYSCEMQADGCTDLILQEDCLGGGCFDGECYHESEKKGKIAYFCRRDDCDDEIEPNVISWLENENWVVVGQAYNSWTDGELDDYDMIVCSDETLACKFDEGTVGYNEHKYQGMPVLEVADYRYAHGAYRFNYINNPFEYLETGDELYKTSHDLITVPFQNPINIFDFEKKIVMIPDYRLEGDIVDFLDIETDHGRTAAFKVYDDGDQGRYGYVGWFYRGLPGELTMEGYQLFNRTVIWVECGDECLRDGNINFPPVASAVLTPNPVAYVNQIVEFDASESYDPEGEPLTYYWDFGDGGKYILLESITIHKYTVPGVYNVTLVVNDGQLNSTPLGFTLTVLPEISNRVALVCKSDLCSEPSEIALIGYLEDNGFDVDGKSENSWEDDLIQYDFMVCASSGGCSIHTYTDVYKNHMSGLISFLEIPDYHYLRAAYKFGYVSWWSGYSGGGADVNVVSADDPITEDYYGTTQVFTDDGDIGSVFHYSMKDGTVNLVDVVGKGASTEFKVDAEGSRGRYAFVGWMYKNDYDDLTPEGNGLLMNTIRWVQCGDVSGCS
jgi:hypothetical protein